MQNVAVVEAGFSRWRGGHRLQLALLRCHLTLLVHSTQQSTIEQLLTSIWFSMLSAQSILHCPLQHADFEEQLA